MKIKKGKSCYKLPPIGIFVSAVLDDTGGGGTSTHSASSAYRKWRRKSRSQRRGKPPERP